MSNDIDLWLKKFFFTFNHFWSIILKLLSNHAYFASNRDGFWLCPWLLLFYRVLTNSSVTAKPLVFPWFYLVPKVFLKLTSYPFFSRIEWVKNALIHKLNAHRPDRDHLIFPFIIFIIKLMVLDGWVTKYRLAKNLEFPQLFLFFSKKSPLKIPTKFSTLFRMSFFVNHPNFL